MAIDPVPQVIEALKRSPDYRRTDGRTVAPAADAAASCRMTSNLSVIAPGFTRRPFIGGRRQQKSSFLFSETVIRRRRLLNLDISEYCSYYEWS